MFGQVLKRIRSDLKSRSFPKWVLFRERVHHEQWPSKPHLADCGNQWLIQSAISDDVKKWTLLPS